MTIDDIEFVTMGWVNWFNTRPVAQHPRKAAKTRYGSVLSAQCSVDRTRTAKFFDLLEAGRLMAVRTDGKNFPRNGVRTVWPSTGLFQVPNICSRA